MTDTYSAGTSAADETSGSSKTDAVKEESSNLKDRVVDSGSNVAGTVKDEAANVAGEAKAQISSLFAQTRDELSNQATAQQQRAAAGLHTVSDDLGEMSRNSSGGIASDLVSQAASRAGSIASWLEGHDPASLLDEVRNFARRRPGTFIAVAAGVGLLAGRITRSAASNAKDAAAASHTRTNTSARTPSVTTAQTTSYETVVTEPAVATPLYSSLAGDESTGVGGEQQAGQGYSAGQQWGDDR
jgi:ElaB/YqjD/DUF883 family membrane-anchored ribosome-binding protein